MKSWFISFLFLITSFAQPQWTNQNPVPEENNLISTFFIDDSTGWIVGSNGFITKMTNSGLDWNKQLSGTLLALTSVQFLNANTGWICGEEGLLMKTIDGGNTWSVQTSGTVENLNDLYIIDNSIWIVGDNGVILRTTNSGINWSITILSSVSQLASVDFLSPTIGWAAGKGTTRGILLKTTNLIKLRLLQLLINQ